MEVTVKEILELEEFKNAELVGGHKGLNNKVNNAFLMEVPDVTPYLQEKSLLITTLYPIYNDKEAKRELIPKLQENNISGICIKPHRYVDEIPESMVKQANQLNFPLIMLPQDSNLSNLISEILTLSLSEELVTLELENYLNERIMNLFLGNFKPSYLINKFAEIIDSYVILLDNEFNVKLASKNFGSRSVHLKVRRNDLDKSDLFIDGMKAKKENHQLKNVEENNDRYGYLIIEKFQNPNCNAILNRFTQVLASALAKDATVLERENRELILFVENLLRSKVQEKELLKQADKLEWELDFPQVIIMIKLLEIHLEEENIDKVAKKLKSELLKKYYVYKNNIEVVYFEEALLVFINNKNKKESTIDFFEKLSEELNHYGDIGIIKSRDINNIDEIHPAYRELVRKMDTATVMSEESFIYGSDEFEIIDLIREIEDTDLLKDYVHKKIGAIIEFDEENNLKLLDTLEAGIKRNFNLRKTSEDMYVHYNTLRYRVDKLKDLGVNTADGIKLGEITLAYNIYKWLQANNDI